jgi:hypothetical protein
VVTPNAPANISGAEDTPGARRMYTLRNAPPVIRSGAEMAGTVAHLRGIAHARLWARSGAANETVLEALAKSGIPGVASDARGMVRRMHEGALSEEVLREAVQRVEGSRGERGLAILYGALLSDGSGAEERLRVGTEELLEEHEIRSRSRAKQARFGLRVGITAMMGALSVPILLFLHERLSKQKFLPVPTLDVEPDWLFHRVLMIVAASIVFLAWRRKP